MNDQAPAAPVATYRKTKTGQWVVCAPYATVIEALHGRGELTVTKADGTTKVERIRDIGRKPFDIDGVPHIYVPLPEPEWKKRQNTGSTRRAGTGDAPRGQKCESGSCGRWAYYEAFDMSGLHGYVCGRCKDEEGFLSFA